MIPVENSSTGSFLRNLDLLQQYDVFAIGEYSHRENHCLIGTSDSTLDGITLIKSHAVVIDQCREYLDQLPGVTISQAADTAASVQLISATHEAAIASEQAADLYGKKVLKRGIQDRAGITRYFLLSASERDAPQRHMEPKTSIVVTLKNQTGAFFKALSCFALRDVNICKMETRPSARSASLAKAWEYSIFFDMDGAFDEDKVAKALDHLREFAESVKILGSYPKYHAREDVHALQGM